MQLVLILDLLKFILGIDKRLVDLSDDSDGGVANFWFFSIFLAKKYKTFIITSHIEQLGIAYGIILDCMWAFAYLWRMKLHILINIYFYFYYIKPKFRLIMNLVPNIQYRQLTKLNKMITSYKKFNSLAPDPVRRQLKAYFHFLGRRKRPKKVRNKLRPQITTLYKKFNALKRSFYWRKKFRKKAAINFRRSFRLWKKRYFHGIKRSFYLGKVRPVKVKRLLARFVGKHLLAVGLLLNFNPIRLITRLFPFFDRFFIRQLAVSGLLWINFKQLSIKMSGLTVGDFVHIAWTPKFVRFYKIWLRRQRRYTREMNKRLYHFYKARRSVSLTRHKNYTRKYTWYNHLLIKTPRWLEVNYLALSFFIINMPRKLSFVSHNFNPYLNRLWAY